MTVWATRADQVDLRGPNPHDLARSLNPRPVTALEAPMLVEIIPIETPTLGDRTYLIHDGRVAFVVDPQRDVDRVLDLAGQAGVSITHVFETHIHNDYVTGGHALAGITGARYYVNAEDPVTFERTPIRDGDVVEVSPSLSVRAVATPGHTFTHLSYALTADGLAVGRQGVGQVCERVPGCGDRPHRQARGYLDDVAVADRRALEGHRVLGVDVVPRTRDPGQRVPASDVVVVDVGLEHVRDAHAGLAGEVEDAVDIALRVHDERHPPVVDQVGTVAERRRLDGDDLDEHRGLQGSDGSGVQAPR